MSLKDPPSADPPLGSSPETLGLPLCLKGISHEGEVDGALYRSVMRQSYRNDSEISLETSYSFPVSGEAVFTGFRARINGKELRGELMTRSDAEELYEEALAEGDSPVMLCETSPGILTLDIGDLEPADVAEAELETAELLMHEGSGCRVTVPTVLAPRSGDMHRDGELRPHETIASSGDAFYPLSVTVKIPWMGRGACACCPSHVTSAEPTEEGLILRTSGGALPDRDFVLLLERLSPPSEAVSYRFRDLAEGGWGTLTLFRPDIPEGSDDIPVFVLFDASSTMAGAAWNQACEILLETLAQIRGRGRALSVKVFNALGLAELVPDACRPEEPGEGGLRNNPGGGTSGGMGGRSGGGDGQKATDAGGRMGGRIDADGLRGTARTAGETHDDDRDAGGPEDDGRKECGAPDENRDAGESHDDVRNEGDAQDEDRHGSGPRVTDDGVLRKALPAPPPDVFWEVRTRLRENLSLIGPSGDKGLAAALAAFSGAMDTGPDGPPALVLLTDCLEAGLRSMTDAARELSPRLFAVAVGHSPLGGHLNAIARAAARGGTSLASAPAEEARSGARRLARRIGARSVSSVGATWRGKEPLWNSPPPRTLAPEHAFPVWALFSDEPDGSPTLAWSYHGGGDDALDAAPPVAGPSQDLSVLMAMARIREAAGCREGGGPELEAGGPGRAGGFRPKPGASPRRNAKPGTTAEDAGALAMRHGILTRQTAWCLVYRRYPDQKAGGIPAFQQIPQNPPETRAHVERVREPAPPERSVVTSAMMESREKILDASEVDALFKSLDERHSDMFGEDPLRKRYPLERPPYLGSQGSPWEDGEEGE
ncbi:MAG: hypothetical protein LBT40_12725 [Deltaproteobacteria bacterium]|jgi:hypothetical protein|nr:hypothetical protein [Deltaproteobacteria bacterium]